MRLSIYSALMIALLCSSCSKPAAEQAATERSPVRSPTLANLPQTAAVINEKSDTFDIANFQVIAEQIRLFKPKDEFDAPPNISNLTGQAFSVLVKPRKRGVPNSICDGFPSWGYFAHQKKFELSFSTASILSIGLPNDNFAAALPRNNTQRSDFLHFVSFTCNKLKHGQYTAANAFGATITVDKETDIVLAFSDQNTPSSKPTIIQYWSTNIPGDEARLLSENIAIRISGTIGVWPNGQNVICGIEYTSPSLDFPHEKTLDACIFKASSLKYEVINQQTNEVLHRTSSQQSKPR